MQKLVSQIKAAAREIGYHACGITSAAPFENYRHALQEWMGRFPELQPLYRGLERKHDPRATAPWVNAIVVCVRRYGKYALPREALGHIGRNYLADRRIDACPDHAMPRRFSAALRDLGLRIKRGGVPDRAAGARAGVVRIGRNGFAYAEGAGSWINLECWRVDAALPAEDPPARSPCPDGCRRCMDACPTGAIVEPYLMRMDRCIAHLTYGAQWPINRSLWKKMGPWIYGCDVCQKACPLNAQSWQAEEPAPWLNPVASKLSVAALAEMDERTYREEIHPLFWYIDETDLDRWHANARRALAFMKGDELEDV